MTTYGTFEDHVAESAPELQLIAERLRQLMFALHPEAVEVVRLGDRAATYGFGPKKMSEGYCYIMPHSAWVNLGFYKGARLSDPCGLLEGTGNLLRHIKVRTLDQVSHPGLRLLVEAATTERRGALFATG